MTSEPVTTALKKRKGPGCLGILGIAVVVIGLVVGLSTWADAAKKQQWAENSGEQSISLSGALDGDGYSISSRATLTTSAEYSETVLHIYVARTDDPPNQTPMVTVALGNNLECSTFRGYIWSTDEGSALDLRCDYFLTLDTLRDTTGGRVTSN